MTDQRQLAPTARSVLRLILAALFIAVSGVAITSAVTSTPAQAAPPPTTRADIITRAHEWYLKSSGQVPGIPEGAAQPGFGRDPDKEFDGTRLYTGWQEPAMGWRTDCSGMVLYAWGLDKSNRQSSEQIGPTFGVQIPFADLQMGDVLGTIEIGHITLFERWIDKAAWTYMAYDFGGGSELNGPMTHQQYQLRDISADGRSQARRVGNDDRYYRAYRHGNIASPTLPPATGSFGSLTTVGSYLHATGTVAIVGWSAPIGIYVRLNGGPELLTYSAAGSGSRPFSARVPNSYLGGQVCVQAASGSQRTNLGCRNYAKPPVTGTVNPQFTTDSAGWIYLTGTVNLIGFDNKIGLTGTVNGSFTPYFVYSSVGPGPRAFKLLAAKIPSTRHGAVFCAYGENSGTKTRIGCATYP